MPIKDEDTLRRIIREEVLAALELWRPPAPRGSQPVVLLSLAEAAEYLDIAEATLRDWRTDRKGPPAVKYGRLVKYRVADLDQWLVQQRSG